MKHLAIVNASPVFTDDEIMSILPAMQKQLDRDFYPAWQQYVPEVKLTFVPWERFQKSCGGRMGHLYQSPFKG